MNLYLLTQTENTGYDTFDSMVVTAPDERTAKLIHPYALADQVLTSSHNEYSQGYPYKAWASSPEKVKATLLGTSVSKDISIVIASFNAG